MAMTIAGNPWDVSSGGGAFKMLNGESSRHLDTLYSTRNYSEEFRGLVSRVSDTIKESTMYRNSVSAVRKLIHGRGANTISRFRGVGEMQHASDINQGYLMANPVVRRLYNSKRLKGYEDTFAKNDKWRGNAYKHSDHNYRIVMDGRLDASEDKFHNYVLTDGERTKLDNCEDIDIMVSWEMQLRHLRETDDDFTSQYNSLRG